MTETETATCDSSFLAEIFGMTVRNINHYVDRGLPVFKRGKAGKPHTFLFPVAMYWMMGTQACKQWEKPFPAPLETTLIGYALDPAAWTSFAEWQEHARKLATDMGCSDRDFDEATTRMVANGMFRTWRVR